MSRSALFVSIAGTSAPGLVLAASLLGLAGMLAGCNETGGGLAGPQTSLVAPAANSAFRLPPGAPCSGEIDGFQAVVKGDLDTGNVDQKIYDQIERDLNRAASACSAGRGGDAHAIVAASKARHGYRA